MKGGEMLAMAGDKRLRIQTAVSSVLLDPHAVAIIKSANGDRMTDEVTVIDSPKNGGVVVRVPGGQFFALNASEQINIEEANGNAPLNGGANHGETSVMQAKADISRLMTEHVLLQCVYQALPTKWTSTPAQYGLPANKQPRKETGVASRTNRPISHVIEEKESFTPIASVETVSSSALQSSAAIETVSSAIQSSAPAIRVSTALGGLDTIGSYSVNGGTPAVALPKTSCLKCSSMEKVEHMSTAPAPHREMPEHVIAAAAIPAISKQMVQNAPAVASVQDNQLTKIAEDMYELKDGDILMAPERTTKVKTAQGIVQIKKGAMVIIQAERKITRVLDLHDKSNSDVIVYFGQQTVKMQPGGEIALVEGSNRDAQKLMTRAENVAHRAMQFVPYEEGKIAVFSQFSMVDALGKHPILMQLRLSNDKADEKLLDNLLKTTAAIFLSQRSDRGPYYSAPGHTGVASTNTSPTK
jgi:hypothetical protein